MATVDALLIGGGLLVVALAIMSARGMASTRRLLIVILLAIVTSGASAVYATRRHAGTGEQISRGYPRPYHFHWRDLQEGMEQPRVLRISYFGANTLLHLGALAFIAALLPRRRVRDGDTRMGAGMVAVRVSLGIFFLLLALIGGLLPIMQGWIFFLLAMLVLFPKARFTEKVLQKAEPKVPRTVAFLRRLGIGTTE